MEPYKSSGLLACAALLALALLSGCGNSSSSQTIPSSATVFYAHSLVFRNHSAMTTGYNSFGQLGDGTLTTRAALTIVPGLGHLVGGAAGGDHTLVFGNATTVRSWGYNLYGQLGNSAVIPTGTSAYSAKPVSVVGFNGNTVSAVAAGAFHSLAIAGGTVYGWGYNGFGQVGNGSFVSQGVPTPVKVDAQTTLTHAVEIAAGGDHSLALLDDGTVWAWGRNLYGQLGLDPASPNALFRQNPVIVEQGQAPLRNIQHIYAAGSYSLALQQVTNTDGTITQTLWGWGYDGAGQLGFAPVTPFFTSTPVPVFSVTLSGPTDSTPVIKKASAGLDHFLMLKGSLASGSTPDATWSVSAMGFNQTGQLGNNDATLKDQFVPVAVQNLPTGVADIIAFGTHSLARVGGSDLTGNIGTWYGWGDNGFGQLGNPISTSSIGYLLIPTKVLGYNP